jgi:hypothetical protein
MQGKKKPAFNKRAGKVFALDYGRLMGDTPFIVSLLFFAFSKKETAKAVSLVANLTRGN